MRQDSSGGKINFSLAGAQILQYGQLSYNLIDTDQIGVY